MKNGPVLFTTILIAFFAAATANAAPATGSDDCQGALPLDKLIRVEVVKGDSTDCPRGARSPYLCAMHKAGFAGRSLGYAMRNTLAALDDGTCERINLRGVLIHTAQGKELRGDKFLDPSRALPTHGLRFGAWKTSVLYLVPEDGQEQLAQCTRERSDCQAALAQSTPPKCPEIAADKECPACPECPTAARCPACPTCTAKIDDLRDCVNARHALQGQVDKSQACGAKDELFNPNTQQCVPSAGIGPVVAQATADRLAEVTAELDRLRAAFGEVRSCIRGGWRFRFTGETHGVCERSPP